MPKHSEHPQPQPQPKPSAEDFKSYRHNRMINPHITVEGWKTIFGEATEELEKMFQEELLRFKVDGGRTHILGN
jgi:hypothetical protein